MLYLGTLITAASGRLNGSVFSRNRGGPYIRAWVNPDQTPTTEREAVWDAMGACGARWATLTVDQRQGWARYSLHHPRPNRIGIHRPVGGFQEFTRANFIPQQANQLLTSGFGWRDDAPKSPEEWPTTTATFALIPPFSFLDPWKLQVTLPGASGWPAGSEAGYPLYISEPQNATRNSWPGPYTLIGVADNPAVGGPREYPIPVPPSISGQVYFVRTHLFDDKGRLWLRERVKVVVP